MNQDTPQDLPKERRTWLGFFIKVFFCLAAFVLVILTVLANMGGHGDFHKSSVEEFVKEITGFPAKLQTLHNLTYFPSISVDLEDLDIMPDAMTETPVAHVDRAQISLGFWDVARQNGKMKAVNIQGFYALPGFYLDKTITLKHLSIIDTGEGNARFEGQGTLDNFPLLFSMDMKSVGSGRSKKYFFDPRRNLNFELGDIKITAVMQNGYNPYLSLQDLKISKGGQEVITGKLDISDRRKREMTITGALKFGEHGTIVKPDLVFDMQARALWGTLASDNFTEKDFTSESRFNGLIEGMINALGDPEIHEKILDHYFEAQRVELNLKGEKTYQGPLKFKDNKLFLQ
jgi:hypothetical protein